MRRFFIASALLLAPGCLPTRDNLTDSANAPNAAIAVVDRRPECAPASESTSLPSVPVASRGVCLALDARETDDPQGTPISKLDFEFQRVTSDDDPEPIGTPFESQGPTFDLPAEYVRSLPTDADIVFRVRVTDPSNAHRDEFAHVTLTNSVPIVRAPPVVLLPVHGRPWEAADSPIGSAHGRCFVLRRGPGVLRRDVPRRR